MRRPVLRVMGVERDVVGRCHCHEGPEKFELVELGLEDQSALVGEDGGFGTESKFAGECVSLASALARLLSLTGKARPGWSRSPEDASGSRRLANLGFPKFLQEDGHFRASRSRTG
jgi:hypothetical protein